MKKLLQDRNFNTIALHRPTFGGSDALGLESFSGLYLQKYCYLFESLKEAQSELLVLKEVELFEPEAFYVGDIKALAAAAHTDQKRFAYNNSIFGPALVNPFKWGANIVLDCLLGYGIVSANSPLELGRELSRSAQRNIELECLEMQTLKLSRFEQSDNAKIVSSYLYAHPKTLSLKSGWHMPDEKRALAQKYSPQGYAPLIELEVSSTINFEKVKDELDLIEVQAYDMQDISAGKIGQIIASKKTFLLYNTYQHLSNSSKLYLFIGIEFIDDIIDELENLLA